MPGRTLHSEVSLSEAELEEVKGRAAELGKDNGYSSATWVQIHGEDHARRVLRMLDDGDPRVDEEIGNPAPLSGEFSDGMTPGKLFLELGTPADLSDFDEADIMTAYEEAFRDGYINEITRACNAQL